MALKVLATNELRSLWFLPQYRLKTLPVCATSFFDFRIAGEGFGHV